MINKLKNLGPGIIITSAFIGPGTVTICTLAGINYGYSLIWCIIFSIIATCYLQEVSSRLGIISRKGLSEILTDIDNTFIRRIIISIIFLSLFIGNAAYESGNISGTVMGLETFIGSIEVSLLSYTIKCILYSPFLFYKCDLKLANYDGLGRIFSSRLFYERILRRFLEKTYFILHNYFFNHTLCIRCIIL